MKHPQMEVAFGEVEKAVAQGNWALARRKYVRYLKAYPKDWKGFYRAGLIEAQGGNFAHSIKAFERALELSTGNLQVTVNLGQIYRLSGRAGDAIPLLELASTRVPEVGEIQIQLGSAYHDIGQLSKAETAYRKAIERGSITIDLLNNLALILRADGRIVEAIRFMEQAYAKAGDSLEILNNLANLYSSIGQLEGAKNCFFRAVNFDPFNPHPHRNLALFYRNLNDGEAAENSARRAAIVKPYQLDGLIILAELLEHRAELGRALKIVNNAIICDNSNIDALSLLARLRRRSGNSVEAIEVASASISRLASEASVYKLYFEWAQAEHVLGRYDDAFLKFSKANEIQRKITPLGKADSSRAFTRLQDLGRILKKLKPTSNIELPEISDHKSPVFIIGFPRSGTTLLDQILDSHPKIQVLEEQPLVSGMIGRMVAEGYTYPQDIGELKRNTLILLRKGYFKDRDNYVDILNDGVFIDKLPLNINEAILINQVFPDAKFLLVLRDPCDVCLSCFMQAFELNDWMAAFTDLEKTKKMYGEVFDLWWQVAEKFGLDYHAVRYEDLVMDLHKFGDEIMGYLGLTWEESMTEFHTHARRRGYLSTPSHSQVTQPLYNHAINRWRRYGTAMESVARALQPYRSKMGYKI